MGFTVRPEALRDAASQVRLAGEGASGCDLTNLGRLADAALPGAASVRAAGRMADEVSSRLATWSKDVRSHGVKLDDSATAYTEIDGQAAEDIAAAGWPR